MNDNVSHLCSIYQTYVSALMTSESKRQTSNQIYLSISLAIITAYSTLDSFSNLIASLMIIFVSITWIITIISYRNISSAKFTIITDIEILLPYAPFTREWERIPSTHKIFGLTRLEKLSPVFFLAFGLYILITGIK